MFGFEVLNEGWLVPAMIAVGALVVGFLLGRASRRDQNQAGSSSGLEQALAQADGNPNALIEPLSNAIQRFQDQQNATMGMLSRDLQSLSKMQQRVSEDTRSLEGALRGSSHSRGHWGELHLRNVFEAAGMVEHVDFHLQVNVWSAEAQLRPDAVIKLPEDRVIVVDAKAPMAAFMKMGNTSDPAERQRLAKEHAAAVRKHARALADKQYWRGFEHTPELVCMFLPSDEILGVAMRSDPALFDFASANRVVLVSPATMVALAKTVAHGWRQQSLGEDAAKLVAVADQVSEKLSRFAALLSGLGRAMSTSVAKYNELLGHVEGELLPLAQQLDKQRCPKSAVVGRGNGQAVTRYPIVTRRENDHSGGPSVH